MITEDDIKKIVLRFLKNYYKFRPRGEGGTTALLDMKTANGIIADGYLTFKKEDGTDFLCTFEATSEGTKEEVIYTYRYWFFIWDIIFGASVLTALLVAGNYYGGRLTVEYVGVEDFLITIGLLFLAFLTIIGMFIRKRSKYRYIYAVQQFKEYHADNQWIAIGTTVFPHTQDMKFRELKYQCIYNGFGLIMINKELEPHFVVTPSRTDLFGKKRRTAEFLTESQLVKKVTQNRFTGVFGKMFKTVFKKAPQFKMGMKTSLARERARAYVSQLKKYRKTAYPQIIGTILMFITIVGIFFLELLNAGFIELDEKRYLKEEDIAKFQKKSNPETKDYVIDSANVVPFDHSEEYTGMDDLNPQQQNNQPEENIEEEDVPYDPIQAPPPLEEPEAQEPEQPEPEPSVINTEDTTTAATINPNPTQNNTSGLDSLSRMGVGIYSPDIASHFVVYDCSRFLNFKGKQYLVQESFHSNLESAKARILDLATYSISANYLWMGCFSDSSQEYIVFLDYLYNDKEEAKENARGYQLELKRKQIFLEALRIKTLQIAQ